MNRNQNEFDKTWIEFKKVLMKDFVKLVCTPILNFLTKFINKII